MVKRFILANPDASIPEVVKACRTSASTVSRARKDLLESGQIAAAPTGRPPLPVEEPSPNEGPTVEAQIAADIDRAISSGSAKALTREERRLRLSAYADHPKVPAASKIAALRELEATEPKESEMLGPGAPQTREEAVQRVRLMIEALGDLFGEDARAEAIA